MLKIVPAPPIAQRYNQQSHKNSLHHSIKKNSQQTRNTIKNNNHYVLVQIVFINYTKAGKNTTHKTQPAILILRQEKYTLSVSGPSFPVSENSLIWRII